MRSIRSLLVPSFAISTLCGCGTNSTGGEAAVTDDASAERADPASAFDGGSSPSDGSVVKVDARTDGPSASKPNPPPGATLCKDGVLSAKDVLDACKLPAAASPAPTNACDSFASNGGRFELWCTNDARYLWAEIDQLRPGPPPLTCPATPDVDVFPSALYSFTAGGAGMGNATVRPLTGEAAQPTKPMKLASHPSITVEATLPTAAASGSVTVWVTGTDTSCLRPNGDVDIVLLAGVAVTWP